MYEVSGFHLYSIVGSGCGRDEFGQAQLGDVKVLLANMDEVCDFCWIP